MKTITEMLEKSSCLYGDKTVFSDENKSVTYNGLLSDTRKIGTAVYKAAGLRKPVAVIFPRGTDNLKAMFGVLAGGCFYTVIDADMPHERINSIFDTLNPVAVLCDDSFAEKARELDFKGEIITLSKALENPADGALLAEIQSKIIDTDIAYTLFTSGSTGVPKGAAVSHRSVLSYVKWYSDCFNITDKTVFGSQTPFYFSMSVSDVFSTVYNGAELNVIPKSLFSFPVKLIEFLNERKVNTIYWVPSALSIIANWKVLDYVSADYIEKVLFAGEVMPVRQLNYWREKLPNAMFANLFGPTETTDICTYYVVEREFSEGETLPIGKHCDNCDVFVLKPDGTEAAVGEEGELYARGSFLAAGYYNNPEKTAAAFVQNPLNKALPETVYKTGDLVKYNDRGELLYLTRADFQIKRSGYRIELGEIDAAAYSLPFVTSAAAVYDKKTEKIVLVYEGKKKETAEVLAGLKERLPDYMLPEKIIRVKAMPINANGKIDRKKLMEIEEN